MMEKRFRKRAGKSPALRGGRRGRVSGPGGLRSGLGSRRKLSEGAYWMLSEKEEMELIIYFLLLQTD